MDDQVAVLALGREQFDATQLGNVRQTRRLVKVAVR